MNVNLIMSNQLIVCVLVLSGYTQGKQKFCLRDRLAFFRNDTQDNYTDACPTQQPHN